MSSEVHDSYPENVLHAPQMNRLLNHRLRNFVAGMEMGLGRLKRQLAEDQAAQRKFDVMQGELSRLLVLTDRMELAFGTLPASDPMLTSSFFHEVSGYFGRTHPLFSLDVSYENSDDRPMPGATLLLKAMQELLDNAVEANPEDNLVELHASMAPSPSTLCLTLSNTGTPFPEKIPHNPPSPFYTSRSRHDGLGLCIACRIVKDLGGQLTVTPSASRTSVKLQIEVSS